MLKDETGQILHCEVCPWMGAGEIRPAVQGMRVMGPLATRQHKRFWLVCAEHLAEMEKNNLEWKAEKLAARKVQYGR